MNCIWASLLAVVLTSRQKSREISHLIKVLLMLELRSSKPISGVVGAVSCCEDRRSPAGVDRVHVRARRVDLVDAVQHVAGQSDFGRAELGLQVLHGPGSDNRRGDGRVLEHEGDGELDQRDAGLLGEGRQLIDRFELALVAR